MAARRPSTAARVGAGIAALLLVVGLLGGILASFAGNGADTTTSSTPTTAATTTTLADADYERIVGGISDLITAADNQRCPLVSAFTAFGQLPDPANEAQVRMAIGVTLELLVASAASALADQPEQAATISATADALMAEAEAAGYAPDWLNTPPGNQALAGEDFVAAFEEYQVLTEELCLQDEGDG